MSDDLHNRYRCNIDVLYVKDGAERKCYVMDVRPGDLIRIKRRLCVGYNSHRLEYYSMLYKVLMLRGSQYYPTAVVRRLDQHRPSDEVYQLTTQYLARGHLVKRTMIEPYLLGDMKLREVS